MSSSLLNAVLRRVALRSIWFLALLTIFAPSAAEATPYEIGWRDLQYAGSTATGGIEQANFFGVNSTPLLTSAVTAGTTDADGNVTFVSVTPFDSGLLICGDNTFTFAASEADGNDTGVNALYTVNLASGSTVFPLFYGTVIGTPFSGATTVPLSLQEINPPLANAITALQTAIDDAKTSLDSNAASVPNLAAQQTELNSLQSALDALAAEPLDQITQAQLDAILANYSDIVTPAIQSALDAFVTQMQEAVAALKTQLATLVEQYSQLADQVTDLVTQGTAWDVNDPSNYGLTADGSVVPDIPVPDFSQTAGAFDPNNDPYAAYATAVIARLNATVQGDGIAATSRPQFVSTVRGWRANEGALQAALQARSGVSQAETNAFLNAQNRVLAVIHQYMDQNDWFLQNPVAQSIRDLVDGALVQAFQNIPGDLQIVHDVKDGLNDWTETSPTPNEQIFQQAIAGIGYGVTDPQFDDLTDFDTYAEMRAALAQVRVVLRTSFQLLTSGTPIGVFNSMCEFITGWEYCTNSGKQLSVWERISSGLDGVLGSFEFWTKLSSALKAGEDLSAEADLAARLYNEPLDYSERVALRQNLGSSTIATIDGFGTEAFTEFTQAGVNNPNTLLTNGSFASADALNAPYLAVKGGQPPFISGTKAILGTSEAQSYVRFYTKGPGTFSTGSFFTLKSEVIGLTPAQIGQKFALPSIPTNVVDVAFPAGEPIAIGTAAGVANGNVWGAGGGFQVFWNKFNINWTLYSKYFTNDRPIGAIFSP